LAQQEGSTVVADDFDLSAVVILVQEVGPSDVSKHREHFGFKFERWAVEDLYRNDHGLAGSDQSLVVKNAKASAGVEGLFVEFVEFDCIVAGRRDCRILFDLGDPRTVNRRDAPDVHERLNVLISPPLREESFLQCPPLRL
jgi:hypothetical protein